MEVEQRRDERLAVVAGRHVDAERTHALGAFDGVDVIPGATVVTGERDRFGDARIDEPGGEASGDRTRLGCVVVSAVLRLTARTGGKHGSHREQGEPAHHWKYRPFAGKGAAKGRICSTSHANLG